MLPTWISIAQSHAKNVKEEETAKILKEKIRTANSGLVKAIVEIADTRTI